MLCLQAFCHISLCALTLPFPLFAQPFAPAGLESVLIPVLYLPIAVLTVWVFKQQCYRRCVEFWRDPHYGDTAWMYEDEDSTLNLMADDDEDVEESPEIQMARVKRALDKQRIAELAARPYARITATATHTHAQGQNGDGKRAHSRSGASRPKSDDGSSSPSSSGSSRRSSIGSLVSDTSLHSDDLRHDAKGQVAVIS